MKRRQVRKIYYDFVDMYISTLHLDAIDSFNCDSTQSISQKKSFCRGNCDLMQKNLVFDIQNYLQQGYYHREYCYKFMSNCLRKRNIKDVDLYSHKVDFYSKSEVKNYTKYLKSFATNKRYKDEFSVLVCDIKRSSCDNYCSNTKIAVRQCVAESFTSFVLKHHFSLNHISTVTSHTINTKTTAISNRNNQVGNKNNNLGSDLFNVGVLTIIGFIMLLFCKYGNKLLQRSNDADTHLPISLLSSARTHRSNAKKHSHFSIGL